MPKVNPAILRWARETAGLDQAEAAERLKIRDARGVAALDRLKALEDGEDTPSRPLLVRMAKQYRRPLLTFYLGSPPPQGDRGQDFRTLPRDQPPDDEPLLDALIRDVQARQSMIRSALLDEDDVQLLDFIGSETAESGVEALVASIRSPKDILESARMGADVATIPPNVLWSLFEHPLTDKGLAAFLSDWKKTGQSIL